MPWLIILGYFLGSIPAAYIFGHILKGVDIRQIGDENMGAANAFRQLSAKAGITGNVPSVNSSRSSQVSLSTMRVRMFFYLRGQQLY